MSLGLAGILPDPKPEGQGHHLCSPLSCWRSELFKEAEARTVPGKGGGQTL